ncbi:hypothetical protein [Baileyella intestinalis]
MFIERSADPEETFREREPYVIRFDQVDSVAVEVDEYWNVYWSIILVF